MAVHVYRPRGAAVELFNCRAPEVVISAGAGTGKSRAALEKMHLMASLNPGFKGLIVRKTMVSLTATGVATYRRHVAAEAIAGGEVTYYGGSRHEPPAFRYINGATISLGGMDKPTRVMSSEYDCVFVQEATELTEEDWEALTTRLRNGAISFQQLMADCNPDHPTHWLLQRANRGATVMLNSRHEDNPVLFNEDGSRTDAGERYMDRLDALTGVRYQRLRLGLWAAAEGVIYDEWKSAVHVIDRFKIPDEWPRWWAVDFGYVHPLVIQCWAEDPDGRLYLYRELYRTKRLVEDAAGDMMSAVTCIVGRRRWGVSPRITANAVYTALERGEREWIEPMPQAIICDHDAEDRATLQKHLRLPVTGAKKAVQLGIQAVQARLRDAGDGRPRLFVLRDSTIERDQDRAAASKPCSLVEELPGYVWLPASAGRKPKEEPRKEDDDACDTMRYMVAFRDLRAGSGVRMLG